MIDREIENAQKLVKTDAYQMSVGEIVNMYKEGELLINPDFQRLFRWQIGQKSKLIESLLLGIPLPSIFVFERDDSKWELIDGLQRISTLLEFMGILKKPNSDELCIPSILVGTSYLPSLDNIVWEKNKSISSVPTREQRELSNAMQLSIRRSRISVEILKRPSENSTKFDLFQRLNAGGTPANPQELRNCAIIMTNPDFFQHIKQMAHDRNFITVTETTVEQREKQKHMEYISRFLVYSNIKYDGKLDIEEYIDKGLIQLAKEKISKRQSDTFFSTFEILNRVSSKNSLRRITEGKHTGRVGWAAFECIAVGIAQNLTNILNKSRPDVYVRNRINAFWESPELEKFLSPGLTGTTRIQRTIPFGKIWFAK